MPAAGIKFVKEGAYDIKASIAITFAGSVGVWIAAKWVESMDLKTLKWVVVFVIIYAGISMLRSALKKA